MTTTPDEILRLWDTTLYDPTICQTVAALREAIRQRDEARSELAAYVGPPCRHAVIVIDRCRVCGAYVGPQP